jgi:Oxidoreductase-like protein, N-terminal
LGVGLRTSLLRLVVLTRQTGCTNCVWEAYWRDLRAYEKELAALRGEQPVPDPFEELERRLASTRYPAGKTWRQYYGHNS